jgi:hypothetical protein
MAPHVLDAPMGGTVTGDVCLACQAFWFDGYESLQLTPGATLRLFRIIGDESSSARTPMPPVTACPRCAMRLVPATDMQRNTRFRYGRGPRTRPLHHFFDFLRESTSCTLSTQQVAELRAGVTVNCSNCGAPIGLATTSSCGLRLAAVDIDATHADAARPAAGSSGVARDDRSDAAARFAGPAARWAGVRRGGTRRRVSRRGGREHGGSRCALARWSAKTCRSP